MSQTMSQTTTTELPAKKEPDADDGSRARRKKLMLAAVIFGVAAALIVTYLWGQGQKGEKQDGRPSNLQQMQKQYAPMFGRSGETTNPNTRMQRESPEELAKLAQAAKDAGLMIMGVTQCGWTRKQRELFGERNSDARKIIESIYIECRTREMCPNIRGYPTWVHGDQQFPGFKDTDNLRALIGQVKPLPAQPMLRMPSEPVDEANFDKFAVDSAPNPKDIKAADEVAQAVAANTGPTVEVISDETEKSTEKPTEKPKEEEEKKEKARGVSDYPPLNVPDMPGTAPMALAADGGPSHSGDQMLQGNTARQSLSNNDAVQELANQMAQSFQQVAVDQQRDPANSLVTRARLPQSATISTGDAFSDKRVPVKKDT
jgi:hypothetical protein